MPYVGLSELEYSILLVSSATDRRFATFARAVSLSRHPFDGVSESASARATAQSVNLLFVDAFNRDFAFFSRLQNFHSLVGRNKT